MPESFGARLRQQREKNGIALEALAKQTRIKESLLAGLERDDLSQWPTGFYRRAFFRAYVSAIQLEPDAAFREFQELYPEPPEGDVVAAMAATLGLEQKRDRSGIRSAVESAISSLARLRPVATPEPVTAAEPVAPAEPVPPVTLPEPLAPAAPVPVAESITQIEAASTPVPSAPAPTEATARATEPEVDLEELARVCVQFGCVTCEEGARSLLQQAASLLHASGLIVWAVHTRGVELHPALVHGYSPRLVAQLPVVCRGDNNATAEAFRTMQTRVFTDSTTGKCAVAIPLRTSSGCVGVFAVELERGIEASKSRVAVATLLAAQLAPIADCLATPAHFALPQAVNDTTGPRPQAPASRPQALAPVPAPASMPQPQARGQGPGSRPQPAENPGAAAR